MMTQVFFQCFNVKLNVTSPKGEAGCNCYLKWMQPEVNGINTLGKKFHTLTKDV